MTTYFIFLAFHPYYEQLFNAHSCAFVFFYSLQNEFIWASGKNISCFPDDVDWHRTGKTLYPHDLDFISTACQVRIYILDFKLGEIAHKTPQYTDIQIYCT